MWLSWPGGMKSTGRPRLYGLQFKPSAEWEAWTW